ncbi:MAG: hypothetical protein M1602_01115 [Firmicutes bacterium]|nr:hypothetical protein [Bacillota bacterium]
MNWFGWILLIAAVGGVLWWLSSGNRATVTTVPSKPAGKDSAGDADHPDDRQDQPGPH